MGSETKAVVYGTVFTVGSWDVHIDREFEERPKEYEMVYSPDPYGGIAIPVPVDRFDTEPVVTGEKITGVLREVEDFPFKELLSGHDSGPMIVDIEMYIEPEPIVLVDTYFDRVPEFPQEMDTVDEMSFGCRAVDILDQ